jgi:lipoyl synthase
MSEQPVVAPTAGHRRLLAVEARNARVADVSKPPWIAATARRTAEFEEIAAIVAGNGLHTVCAEAGCPNVFECWSAREATFLIGGDRCTRRCDFCLIASGRPRELDREEPERVAASVAAMRLTYATVTGVARDDLPDAGAWLYAETVHAIRRRMPATRVELLAPDFGADPGLLSTVFGSRPDVFAHNIETVPRIFRRVRPGFRFARSLAVMRAAREEGLIVKSNVMLGLGETRSEVLDTFGQLRLAGCELLTITQYLRPSERHHPVVRWASPDEFEDLRLDALRMGFAGVLGGPLVRSSYKAGELYRSAQAPATLPASLAD